MQLQNVLYFLIWAGLFFVMVRLAAAHTSWLMIITVAGQAPTITATTEIFAGCRQSRL